MEFKDILKNISEHDLEILESLLRDDHSYQVLSQKTQIKNSGVEEIDINFNTRQLHSQQVGNIAGTIVASAKMSRKEQQIAQIVGLCHDLGHTPFGHDGEVFFSKKNGGKEEDKFNHAKYGVEIFKIAFANAINKKEDGELIFSKETIKSFEELGSYIEAGISYHQEGYYAFAKDSDLDSELDNLSRKNPIELTREESLKLKAFKTPCIQAAMLSDTLAIMQTDTADMTNSATPFGTNSQIISMDRQLELAKGIGFSEQNLNQIANQLFKNGYEIELDGKTTDEKLAVILEKIGDIGPEAIQGIIAASVGEQGLNEHGRFESIPEAYKLLADKQKERYQNFTGMTFANEEEWKEHREIALAQERAKMKEKNPLLCLTYEIQNELMYNEIIYSDKIKFLDNDLDRNYAIFDRVYDYIYEINSKEESELTPEELKIKKELDEIETCPNVGDGSNLSKNKTTYYMQRLGNKDIKKLYSICIEPKENTVLETISDMRKEGKNENDIVSKLGIDKNSYTEFNDIDKSKRISIMLLSGKKKDEILKEMNIDETEYAKLSEVKTKGDNDWERKCCIKEAEKYLSENPGKQPSEDEILKLLRMEKRDLSELRDGKTTLERYVEYEMPLKEMDGIDVDKEKEAFGKVDFRNIAKSRKKADLQTSISDIKSFENKKRIQENEQEFVE